MGSSSHQTSASWTSALQVFSEARDLSQQSATKWHTEIFTSNTVLKTCDRSQQWQQASAVCAAAVAETLRADVATCSSVICAAGRGKLWQEAFAWLFHFCSAALEINEIVYNSLLTVNPADASSKWRSSLCILDVLKVQLRKDVVSFNTLITACDRSKDWSKALIVFRHCQQDSVETTTVSLGASISACQRSTQWQKALDISMQRGKCVMSNVLRNSLISACTTAGAWQHAMTLAAGDAGYAGQNLRFDHFTMNTLMCGPGRPGVQWRSAVQMADRMRLPWDLVTYNSAFQVHCDSGEWEPSFQLVQELNKGNLRPNILTVSSLMSSCGQFQQWQASYGFCTQMIGLKLEANIVFCNAMMSANEKRSRWTTALELQQNTQDLGIRLSVVSFGSIINACEKERRWTLALALVNVLQGKNLEWNQITSSSSLRVLGSCGKWFDASALLQQLQSCASKMDPFSFTATSDACVEAAQWIQTLNLLDVATCSEGFQVSLGNIAISASGEAEEWQEAIQLFSTSVARSVQKTMVTHNAATSAFAQSVQWWRALGLLAQLGEFANGNDITFTAVINACEKAQVGETT